MLKKYRICIIYGIILGLFVFFIRLCENIIPLPYHIITFIVIYLFMIFIGFLLGWKIKVDIYKTVIVILSSYIFINLLFGFSIQFNPINKNGYLIYYNYIILGLLIKTIIDYAKKCKILLSLCLLLCLSCPLYYIYLNFKTDYYLYKNLTINTIEYMDNNYIKVRDKAVCLDYSTYAYIIRENDKSYFTLNLNTKTIIYNKKKRE